jgi:ribosomal protein S18 acetylase RimI-like enzyme
MQQYLITDRKAISQYLLKYPHLNNYHLGDLDDFFWPFTTWYALKEQEEITAICLLYSGAEPVVLLSILNDNEPAMRELITGIIPCLPDKFYAHLSPGLEDLFKLNYHHEHHGEHLKMALGELKFSNDLPFDKIVKLSISNLEEVQNFYTEAYPGNWFDPRMLKTDQYLGIRNEEGKLICVGGVHVYSEKYGVGVLGNIATHPDYRNKNFGTILAISLCKTLTKVQGISLNVLSDNSFARKIYGNLGFEEMGVYHEWMFSKIQ